MKDCWDVAHYSFCVHFLTQSPFLSLASYFFFFFRGRRGGNKPRTVRVIKKKRGIRKDAKQCQVKYDYCFKISHRETHVPRRWIHLKQGAFLDVLEGKSVPPSHWWGRGRWKYLSSHFLSIPCFPLVKFHPIGSQLSCTSELYHPASSDALGASSPVFKWQQEPETPRRGLASQAAQWQGQGPSSHRAGD